MGGSDARPRGGDVTHLIETRSAATASVWFRALQQLFNWLVDEGGIGASPMDKLRPPTVPERETPVLSPTTPGC